MQDHADIDQKKNEEKKHWHNDTLHILTHMGENNMTVCSLYGLHTAILCQQN